MLMVLLASVYLNGVNIDGLRSQTFEKCRSVKIDDRGDVRLDCPAYQVESQPTPAGAPPPPLATAGLATSITKHYWLVTEQNDGAAAQYDVDVFVNSKWVRKVKSGDGQMVLEITKYLQPGANKVLFAATKHLEAGRKSTAAGSYVKFIVGEGEAGGNNVMIDNPLIEMKRSAAETDNLNEEFTIQGR
ncbi:MAG: hypothetical protein E6J78_04320 [Deltaproteobacteria bacterium]|nr:MAG: hypothetical protein E6J78_04320 [Deltaproteobacteria bacterium]